MEDVVVKLRRQVPVAERIYLPGVDPDLVKPVHDGGAVDSTPEIGTARASQGEIQPLISLTLVDQGGVEVEDDRANRPHGSLDAAVHVDTEVSLGPG